METTIFVLVWLLGLAFWGGMGYGVYLWIRKLRRELRDGAPEGSLQRQLLDELQELRIEMGIVIDRLGRLESRLGSRPELEDGTGSGELTGAPAPSETLPPRAVGKEEPPAGATERRGEDPVPPPPGDARS